MSDATSLAAKLAVLKEYGLLDRVGEVDGVKLFAPLPPGTDLDPFERHQRDKERKHLGQEAWEKAVRSGQLGRWAQPVAEAAAAEVPADVKQEIRAKRQAVRAGDAE